MALEAIETAKARPDSSLTLSDEERAILGGERGPAPQLAMRIVVRMARILGARELVPVASAHIDGCLYHGDGGVEFAERLVSLGGKVAVPTTLNVGALDLLHPRRVRSAGHRREMALRLMRAYEALGCRPTWTCAPYQAGHRPERGQDVAWGESNAVVFANSVLGARTNRYGDFMDICCALAGRAPRTGLHLEENRRATVVMDTRAINPVLRERDVFYPVLGTWLGATVGERVAVVTGLPDTVTEDQLKAMGAASASSGESGSSTSKVSHRRPRTSQPPWVGARPRPSSPPTHANSARCGTRSAQPERPRSTPLRSAARISPAGSSHSLRRCFRRSPSGFHFTSAREGRRSSGWRSTDVCADSRRPGSRSSPTPASWSLPSCPRAAACS